MSNLADFVEPTRFNFFIKKESSYFQFYVRKENNTLKDIGMITPKITVNTMWRHKMINCFLVSRGGGLCFGIYCRLYTIPKPETTMKNKKSFCAPTWSPINSFLFADLLSAGYVFCNSLKASWKLKDSCSGCRDIKQILNMTKICQMVT